MIFSKYYFDNRIKLKFNFSMSQDNLYLFEAYITKCSISQKRDGEVFLFLRIGRINNYLGKTTSSILKAKVYDEKALTF